MAKIFRVYAANGPNRFEELDLPASGYEMLDLMDRLRLAPGQLPYMEILEYAAHGFLTEHMVELPDIFQLNALARQLGKLDTHGLAAFEGLVGMDIQKKETPIPLPRLIDFAHSADRCHVVGNVMTDVQLGRFCAKNGFVPEADDLSDAAFEMLDFGKTGREYREAEGGVFTSLGYVEQHSELHHVSETMDFQPQKPDYTIRLSIMALPLNIYGRQDVVVTLGLPAPEEELNEALKELGRSDWTNTSCSINDCPIPSINNRLHFEEDAPLILELAQCLRELDGRGEMLKYKAVLAAEDTRDLSRMLEIAGTLDEYLLETKTGSPEDVAREELGVILCEQDMQTLIPHINLRSYGCALLERDHAVITGYGLLEHRAPEQIQNMNSEHSPRGMEMM